MLEYGEATPAAPAVPPVARPRTDSVGVAFIGAGNFARGTLLPAFTGAGARLVAVTSQGGLTAADTALRFGA